MTERVIPSPGSLSREQSPKVTEQSDEEKTLKSKSEDGRKYDRDKSKKVSGPGEEAAGKIERLAQNKSIGLCTARL